MLRMMQSLRLDSLDFCHANKICKRKITRKLNFIDTQKSEDVEFKALGLRVKDF